ncbi:Rossmann-like alpha/beta/alpha sandwich fold [Ostreococcus tauri]|uniref:Rossmann-like alpha/beta/alpha sandwich fold n=1 Tax=Ostreococcus tauri TaxID=70448 RepID=Q01ED9_OSTTA|nr:Rossmann-like alpha/beta/alpha sandwich fold [Ostreococcus tauri]CAL52314.1 Rossmann-like alpha/beta/alpha sandwich fold [Ostreococcus tauri]|eukprot:XP_003075042.1 Rossmann-like alpha/beta/alpha sandwich fold [Ostreococcus tauri]
MCGISLSVCHAVPTDSKYKSREHRISPDVDIGLLTSLSRRGPDGCGTFTENLRNFQVQLCATLLQFRGNEKARSPLISNSEGVLAFNGEIYGGLPHQAFARSDTASLFRALGDSRTLTSKLELLSRLRGPWAFIYVDIKQNCILIGKDRSGRKSLVLHFPDSDDERLLVCSTGTTGSVRNFWSELGCGLHCIRLTEPMLVLDSYPLPDGYSPRKVMYTRTSVHAFRSANSSLRIFQYLIDRAVRTRVYANNRNLWHKSTSTRSASVAILFSGGLDSTTLATLAHRHMPFDQVIDLCNVCFHGGSSPDRLAAIEALQELRNISPGRRWRFIQVNVEKSEVFCQLKHIVSLVQPQDKKMDYNIGVALWFASRARGHAILYNTDDSTETLENYDSEAKIMLLGNGADEILGGYRRHKLAFDRGGLSKLAEELNMDMERLWVRNMGRDDRIVSDSSREARYPFLDEELVHMVSGAAIYDIVDFKLPPGEGDKMILRSLARALGLSCTSKRVKRALQYGSKVNKLENELFDELFDARDT